jgi:hypothetical protein
LSDKKIGVLFNAEFLHTLINDFGVKCGNIIMFADDPVEYEFCRLQYGMIPGINLFLIDIAKTVEEKELYTVHEGKWSDMKQFDVIVGNPPYQAANERVKDTKKGACGTVIWDKFVGLSLDLVKENGYLCLVHPAGWRRPNKRSKDIGEKIVNKKVLYLELHSIADGLKTFGASTNYDWYVLQNCPNDGATTVKDFSGKVQEINLKDWVFIPNEQFDLVSSILAKQGEEAVELLYSRSSYGTDKPQMRCTPQGEFKYPCVYSLPEKGTQLWYSNTTKNGHFGIPKVIFSNGAASQIIMDKEGEYGLTQFAFGIVDTVSNLPKIKKALESKKFIDLCKCFRFTFDRYDDDCIRLFRKDFWREFL